MGKSILLIATAALATAVQAEPVKTEAREAPASANRPAQVVLASAEQVPAAAPLATQPAETPVKRPRAARVTSCRCGDQTAANHR